MSDRISSLELPAISSKLRNEGLFLKTGPFTYRIRSSVSAIAEGIHLLYGDATNLSEVQFIDFEIGLNSPSLLRRFFRPKLDFYFDQKTPFKPLPLKQAYAFFEWGMNWCVSVHMNQYLKLHAAVLERNGKALVMPAEPGSGKSTLCAALMLRGWRLLSDEHALVSIKDGKLIPVCRPVSLKNQSIDVIRDFEPKAIFGPISEDTHKGTVSHLKPTRCSVDLGEEGIAPGWLVFPRYIPDSETRLTECLKEVAFLKAGDQSFNYSLLGSVGFEAMSRLIETSDCYNFHYSNLDEAVAVFEALSEGKQ